MSIGPDASFVADDEADGNEGATVAGAFLLSRFEFAAGLTGLLAEGLAAGGFAVGFAGGVTGCDAGDAGAVPGWTIFTTFSSR